MSYGEKKSNLPENREFYKTPEQDEVRCRECNNFHKIKLEIVQVEKHKKVYLYYLLQDCVSPKMAFVVPRAWLTEFKDIFFRERMFWKDVKDFIKQKKLR